MNPKLTDMFLHELDTEAAATRRTLQRVPEGRNDWKPHPKSMELGYLAGLVATLPGWVSLMVDQDDLDLHPVGGKPLRSPMADSNEALLELFDQSVAAAKRSLENTTDAHLLTHWRLLMGGHAISDEPRYQALRGGVFNHLAHHRGQLTVYLRLNEAAVPAIYGPSADEQF